MILSTINPLNIAGNVWTSGTRTLTSTFNSGYAIIGATGRTLAAGASVTFQPQGAFVMRVMSYGLNAGAAGSATVNLFDSITATFYGQAASNGHSIGPGTSTTTTVYFQFVNGDVVNAAGYAYTGWDIS